MFARDKLWIVIAAALVLGVSGFLIWQEANPGYLGYQREFRRLVEERLGPERAAAVPTGLQQIWLPEADRVDRCTSCHLGVTWQGLDGVEAPYGGHPAGPLEHHPVERFGCTLCHGGQGEATRLPDAHGWVAHWDDPLLDRKLAQDYRLADRWAFLEIKCNACHRYDREIPGAPRMNLARRLVDEKGCRACHRINGRGGSIGPDLERLGEKNPEGYDYGRLTTLQSLLSWQIGHLQSPKTFSPDTVMPEFGFTRDQALSLGLMLRSWTDVSIPIELRPGVVLADVPTAEELERERIMREGDGRFFVEKTCFICHDVSSFGIQSATKIGPDLAVAVDDVPRRFGRTLESFLMEPSGTMQVVLSKQIQLTEQERREAIRLLGIAYQKHLEALEAPDEGASPQ